MAGNRVTYIRALHVGDFTAVDTVDLGGVTAQNAGTPAAPADVATKAYVDGLAGGGLAAGAASHIQFHGAGGGFAGDPDFTWDTVGDTLAVSDGQARVVVGSQVAESGAVLQLKSSLLQGLPQQEIRPGPSRLTYQASQNAVGGGPAAFLTYLALPPGGAAYLDIVFTAVVVGGALAADVAVEHVRCVVFSDAARRVTIGATTTDFRHTSPGVVFNVSPQPLPGIIAADAVGIGAVSTAAGVNYKFGATTTVDVLPSF